MLCPLCFISDFDSEYYCRLRSSWTKDLSWSHLHLVVSMAPCSAFSSPGASHQNSSTLVAETGPFECAWRALSLSSPWMGTFLWGERTRQRLATIYRPWSHYIRICGRSRETCKPRCRRKFWGWRRLWCGYRSRSRWFWPFVDQKQECSPVSNRDARSANYAWIEPPPQSVWNKTWLAPLPGHFFILSPWVAGKGFVRWRTPEPRPWYYMWDHPAQSLRRASENTRSWGSSGTESLAKLLCVSVNLV